MQFNEQIIPPELERQAFIKGDALTASLVALIQDAESDRDEAMREATEAEETLAAVRRVLKTVIESAERFAYDSEMTGDDIKVLANVLDNAKDSI